MNYTIGGSDEKQGDPLKVKGKNPKWTDCETPLNKVEEELKCSKATKVERNKVKEGKIRD